ncbi:GNAT superfamily N-acetyltransferase [Sphingomonas insulae]|uniref:N-acetyltransferase domain-containing protein n=1 Tax=Sphingomonas insulae TaxID=424800 RepID=A0ABP3T1X9_9SPHN|nr:GNAT family N-acetyltransferase [Sphingomonas insulae]NIJ28729.1 GNAT superfamily N-acetyltransferase [Sphingomonas insulae]
MTAIDPALVHGWLAARSLSRGLPAPVADGGGWRVDTDAADETRRYVFAAPVPGLLHLAETIAEPRIFLKLCADAATLRRLLPARWAIIDANCMMVTDASPIPPRTLPPGYALATTTTGAVSHVTITAPDGTVAASGYAAERDGIFAYDRIVTTEPHRRRGLGSALMAALGATRTDDRAQQILTATTMGVALYRSLGWRVYCPYTTAGL